MTEDAGGAVHPRVAVLLRRVARRPIAMTGDSTLVGDLGLESIQIMELIAAIEHEFDLDIEQKDVEHVRTVDDLVMAVAAML